MKRSELEHLIRAAGSIANDPEIVVVGSQSILGQFPNAPPSLPVSAEAGVFPLNHPELSDLIAGSIQHLDPHWPRARFLEALCESNIHRRGPDRGAPAGADDEALADRAHASYLQDLPVGALFQ